MDIWGTAFGISIPGMGFFQSIKARYGNEAVSLLKQWARLGSKLSSFGNRKIFLLKCRQTGIIPRHITDGTRNLGMLLDLTDGHMGDRIRDFNTRLNNKLINLEISLTISTINRIEKSLKQVREKVLTLIPGDVVDEFGKRQQGSCDKKFKTIKKKNINKFQNLKSQQHHLTIKTQDNWVKNISEVEVPDDVLRFLSLGSKFSVPPRCNEISVKRLIADVETIIKVVPENAKNTVRAKFTNVLTNFLKQPAKRSYIDILLKKTKKIFKDHAELVVSRADKGNVTVIMSKDTYIQKSNEILMDRTYYERLRCDPTSTYQQKANKLVKSLKDQKQLTHEVAKTLNIYNQTCPKFYGLPKIHKPQLSLRPIISSINAPNSKLASLLTQVLTKAYNKNNDYFTGDSFEFSSFINDKQLPNKYVLVSLDVVSLFSNIPYNLVEKSIKKHWNRIRNHTDLSQISFLKILQFVFDTTYFRFNNEFYKQKLGTPMGAIISPILAQYVMDDLLEVCVDKLSFQLPFLKKYVDDIITSIPESCVRETLTVFNSYDAHIQFTVEEEIDKSVPFLDTKVIRNNDNKIILDWYIKPTSSGRYMNFHSYHTTKTKINLVIALKTRIERISHPSLRQKNLNKLYDMLINNSYPSRLTKKLLYSTTPLRAPNPRNTVVHSDSPEMDDLRCFYFSLPYIKELTTTLTKILRAQTNIKIAYKQTKTLGSVFSKLKDKDEVQKNSEVIYSIPCNQCDQVYIGQTSRVLKDRITSHKSDCRLNKNTCSLATHSNQMDHDVNFVETKILHKESNYNKRAILEMVEIFLEPKSVNKRSDIDGLSVIYSNVLTLQPTVNRIAFADNSVVTM
ncbi:uncharacterized protein LOC132708734 [Cylas formicarius]|uniref:uncharacterized protein LOC132708734 n=1 Tax=Cylas formicarius TaxID=197179 RepID=UPI0029584FAA|nr:uncharacterized protein LOC132708734 [Cylas formicarius]